MKKLFLNRKYISIFFFFLLILNSILFQNCSHPGSIFVTGGNDPVVESPVDGSTESPVREPDSVSSVDSNPNLVISKDAESCDKPSNQFEDLINQVPQVNPGSVPKDFVGTFYEKRAVDAELANPGIDFGFNIEHSNIKDVLFLDGSSTNTICILTKDNNLYCRGRYYSSELAITQNKNSVQLVAVGVQDAVLSGDSVCVITTSNQLRCTRVGTTSLLSNEKPNLIVDSVASFKSESANKCFLKLNGDLYCFGANESGQIGNNSKQGVGANNPYLSLQNVKLYALSKSSICAVNTSNQLYCWGNLSWFGSTYLETFQLTPKLQRESFNATGLFPTRATNSSYCYIMDSELRCFGATINSILGGPVNNPVLVDKDVKTFYSENRHNFCYITTADQAKCLSISSWAGQAPAISGPQVFTPAVNNVKSIYLADGINCYHGLDDSIRCSGYADNLHPYFFGSAFPNKVLDQVSSLDMGNYGTCALRTNGDVSCWGQKSYLWYPKMDYNDPRYHTSFRTFNGIGAKQLSARYLNSLCFISESGELICRGSILASLNRVNSAINNISACRVSSLGVVKKVAVSTAFACASDSQNSISCFGDVSTLVKDKTNKKTITIGNLGELKDIQAGNSHVCALNLSGEVYCWGRQSAFSSATLNSESPFKITNELVKKLFVKSVDTCAILMNNEIHCYRNGVDVKIAENALSYDTSGYDSCYVDLTNQLWCKQSSSNSYFGNNSVNSASFSKINYGLKNEKVTDVQFNSSGNLCYVNTDKELYCAGSNILGLLGINLFHNFPMSVKF